MVEDILTHDDDDDDSVLPSHVWDLFTHGQSIISHRSGICIVSLSPHPQAGAPPLVNCVQLLIQNIHRYVPCLGAVSVFRILKICFAMVTWTHLAWIGHLLLEIRLLV